MTKGLGFAGALEQGSMILDNDNNVLTNDKYVV